MAQPTGGNRAEAQQLAFVEAARCSRVEQIVKLSQLHANHNSPVRFLRYHAAVESAIQASGMASTFLRPNLYFPPQTIGRFGRADALLTPTIASLP